MTPAGDTGTCLNRLQEVVMASLKKRGKSYYAQYYLGGKQKRVSLNTTSHQIAKEKLRQIESALFRDADLPLPTRTPLNKVIAAYCDHLSTVKTFRNAQRDCTIFARSLVRFSSNCKFAINLFEESAYSPRAANRFHRLKLRFSNRSPQPRLPTLLHVGSHQETNRQDC